MRAIARTRALTLAVVLAGGCADRIERAAGESSARTIDLPPARATRLPALQPRTTVVITPEGIDVDQAELVASWSGPAREKALSAKAFAWPRAVKSVGFRLGVGDVDRPGSFLLTGLEAALHEAALLEKARAQIDPSAGFAGRLAVLGDRRTPYELLSRVLYTAGQAAYSTWDLALAATGRRVALTVEAPRIGDLGEEHCVGPLIGIGPAGIQVQAGGGGAHAEPGALPQGADDEVARRLAVLGDLPPTPAPTPRWLGAVMLGPSRACPSVPQRAGHHDTAAFLSLVREMETIGPRCGWAIVTPASDTRWEDLAGVLEVLHAEAGYAHLGLGVVPQQGTAPSCDGGMRPSEARERAAD